MLKDSIGRAVRHIVVDFNNPLVVRIFFKALVLLTIVKILLLWSFSHAVLKYHDITLPRSLPGKFIMAPAFLANENVDVFFAVAIVLLVAALILRPSYFTTAFLFWLTFNLYVVYLPFANGSDLILFMLALWCIPMATIPQLKSEVGATLQKTCYNAGIILCRLQIVFIYLISGVDKLKSEVWRTGVAFDYVIHLSNMFNPAFAGIFDNPAVQLILSWLTILFELAFAVLVWFKKTKIPMLVMGIVFHFFIWIVLSLPDFAAVMIVSYIIFLDDADLMRLTDRFRR